MDVSEYLPMFLAEGREHLQELNLAVVLIEEQPDDPETVDAAGVTVRVAAELGRARMASADIVGLAAAPSSSSTARRTADRPVRERTALRDRSPEVVDGSDWAVRIETILEETWKRRCPRWPRARRG